MVKSACFRRVALANDVDAVGPPLVRQNRISQADAPQECLRAFPRDTRNVEVMQYVRRNTDRIYTYLYCR